MKSTAELVEFAHVTVYIGDIATDLLTCSCQCLGTTINASYAVSLERQCVRVATHTAADIQHCRIAFERQQLAQKLDFTVSFWSIVSTEKGPEPIFRVLVGHLRVMLTPVCRACRDCVPRAALIHSKCSSSARCR